MDKFKTVFNGWQISFADKAGEGETVVVGLTVTRDRQRFSIDAEGKLRFEMWFGQWLLVVTDEAGTLTNPDPIDPSIQRFYRVEWGAKAPGFIAEPSRRLDVPQGLAYVDHNGVPVVPDQKIGGIICDDGLRTSFSGALMKKPPLPIGFHGDADGSFEIAGKKMWLLVLLQPDKNRIDGYNAFFTDKKPDSVLVIELGELMGPFKAFLQY
jgi:hypothetical protein